MNIYDLMKSKKKKKHINKKPQKSKKFQLYFMKDLVLMSMNENIIYITKSDKNMTLNILLLLL